MTETIVAISSASGRSAIGIVRLSGPLSKKICYSLTNIKPKDRRVYSTSINYEGDEIDHAVVFYFKGPKSYTGEDQLEIQCHGNPIILNEILRASSMLGARLALPGEFTKRAFLNGKLTLDQAEAVADVIEATTLRATKSANRTLKGAFSKRVTEIVNSIRESYALVEACIDFIEDINDDVVLSKIEGLIELNSVSIADLIARVDAGRTLNEGINVAILGPPNSGKSTLLNRLAGNEVAIVSNIPGTTRDVVSSNVNVNGVPVHLVDTAGIRATEDTVEKIGIAKAFDAAQNADLILYLVEDNKPDIESIKNQLNLSAYPSDNLIIVRNKIDKLSVAQKKELSHDNYIPISARNGDGVNTLLQSIFSVINISSNSENEFTARERHAIALRKSLRWIQSINLSNLTQSPELVAEHLREATRELENISGRFDTEEMLGVIFNSFCIGK